MCNFSNFSCICLSYILDFAFFESFFFIFRILMFRNEFKSTQLFCNNVLILTLPRLMTYLMLFD